MTLHCDDDVFICRLLITIYTALFQQIIIALLLTEEKENETKEINIRKYNLTRPKHIPKA